MDFACERTEGVRHEWRFAVAIESPDRFRCMRPPESSARRSSERMEKIWLKQYPAGVPAQIEVNLYASLVTLMEESFTKYRNLPAYLFMGKTVTFGQVDDASRALAAYLQSLGLDKGDRIAIMLPNVPQYPVAVAAILRAGYVVVNVNPLYTPRELEHQLKDSGAKAIVILENFAATLAQVIDAVPAKKVVLAAMGDMLGFIKGAIVNHVVRNVKRLVPAFSLPQAVRFNDALAQGRRKTYTAPKIGADDIAVLQYTGGTTGVSKGAVLLHRNLVANLLQSEAWYQPALKKIAPGEQIVTVCALPLYHIFGFNTNMMLSMRMGGCNILIPNPRDIPALL
jgi:long-chain acyl-CoA synthetase